MEQEIKIFKDYVKKRELNKSWKRDFVLQTFLQTKDHVSVEDLYGLIKKKHPEVGMTTVFRTMKLVVACGLAEVVDFDDGVRRYERKLGREYHAHLICTKCGRSFESFDKSIQDLASRLAKKKGFTPQKHRLEIFGVCGSCK